MVPCLTWVEFEQKAIGWGLIVVACSLGGAWILFAAHQALDAAQRERCRQNLRQIAEALEAYRQRHDSMGLFENLPEHPLFPPESPRSIGE